MYKSAMKFVGGMLMTLVFVIVVPIVTDSYITPFLTDAIGDTNILWIGSETIVQILLFLVFIGFVLILGGGAVLRWCGLFGILGLIVAYWLLGDVTKATIPVISAIIVYVILWGISKRKREKKD